PSLPPATVWPPKAGSVFRTSTCTPTDTQSSTQQVAVPDQLGTASLREFHAFAPSSTMSLGAPLMPSQTSPAALVMSSQTPATATLFEPAGGGSLGARKPTFRAAAYDSG